MTIPQNVLEAAQLFADTYKGTIYFVPEEAQHRKYWMYWSGEQWVREDSDVPLDLVRKMLRNLPVENESDRKKRNRLLNLRPLLSIIRETKYLPKMQPPVPAPWDK